MHRHRPRSIMYTSLLVWVLLLSSQEVLGNNETETNQTETVTDSLSYVETTIAPIIPVCSNICKCTYMKNGGETAIDCSEKGLTSIPIIKDLPFTYHIVKLDLSRNPGLFQGRKSVQVCQIYPELKELSFADCGLNDINSFFNLDSTTNGNFQIQYTSNWANP